MTYDDDFIRVRWDGGMITQPCKALGVTWPPPEYVELLGEVFKRSSMSKITDAQRAEMTRVCRGAEYRPATKDEIKELEATVAAVDARGVKI
jgi:hypothetical protein